MRPFANMPYTHKTLLKHTNNCGNLDLNRSGTNQPCVNAGGFQSRTDNAIPQCTDVHCDNDYTSESEITRIAASCVRRYTLEESKALATTPSNCINGFCHSTECRNADTKAFCSCDHMSSDHQNAATNVDEQSNFCLNPSQLSGSVQNYQMMPQYTHAVEGTYGDSNQVAAQCSTSDRGSTPQMNDCVQSRVESFQDSCDRTPSQCNSQKNQAQRLAEQCSPCRIAITGCERPISGCGCDYKTPKAETNSKMRSAPGQLSECANEEMQTPIIRLGNYENIAKYEKPTCLLSPSPKLKAVNSRYLESVIPIVIYFSAQLLEPDESALI